MYRIIQIEKWHATTASKYKYETERGAMIHIFQSAAQYLEKYQKSGKKGRMDCVEYEGMVVARVMDAKSIFLYRVAVVYEQE